MVVNKVVSVYDADGKLLRTESITDYTKKNILDSFATIDTFTSKWNEIKKKSDIADMLKERGIDLAELKTSQEMSNVDDFDFICHIAYGKKTLTRRERAEQVKSVIYLPSMVSRHGWYLRICWRSTWKKAFLNLKVSLCLKTILSADWALRQI